MTTIRAVLKNGAIQPLEELPEGWHDGQTLSVEEGETDVDAEAVTIWAREIEEAAREIPESEHQRFMEALADHRREAKEYMRRRIDGATE